MENESTENIIDSSETNEEETLEENPVEETTEDVPEEKKTEEKPQETPEAKHARLRRQLEQHEKKYGFAPPKPKAKTEPQTELSYKDNIALINAKVHEDDIDEVIEYAKFKGISVSEALKSSVIKTSLAERSEQRNTAEVTNTSKTRGTSSRTSAEALISKAEKTGELPDSAEDLDRMLEKRYETK